MWSRILKEGIWGWVLHRCSVKILLLLTVGRTSSQWLFLGASPQAPGSLSLGPAFLSAQLFQGDLDHRWILLSVTSTYRASRK